MNIHLHRNSREVEHNEEMEILLMLGEEIN